MHTEIIDYKCDEVNLKGYLACFTEVAAPKLPGIVIAHAWKGQDSFAREKADALAKLGYVALAADLYGDGQTAKTDEEATKLMLPLFLDRALLRKRINAAVDTLKKHPFVDDSKIGAIGFCFGGMTVIELVRSGADVSGVVSIHGILGHTFGEHKAAIIPNAKKLKGALLILHGALDPFVTHDDIFYTQDEFTKAEVDWQMHTYGHAMHAFTNPAAHEAKKGMEFNSKAAHRAWQEMHLFFSEIFKKV